MRTIFIALLVAFFALPKVGFAQSINVRAGEHNGFTRVVVRIPNQSEWQLDSEPGRIDIIFRGYSGRFNIENLFQIIPRTRVLDAQEIDGGFSLLLSCECKVETFIAESRFLAIDILDGPPLGENSSDIQLIEPLGNTTPNGSIATSQFLFGDLLWSNTAEQSVLRNGSEESNASGVDALKPVEKSYLDEIRSQLQSSFMTAASRGIIDVRTADTRNNNYDSEVEFGGVGVGRISSINPTEPVVDHQVPGSLNMRVSNSSERPDGSIRQELLVDSASCLEGRNLDISTWADTSTGVEQLSELRSSLFDDRDQVRAEIALRLARAYLFFGFGPEAREVLSLSREAETENPEIYDIADVMEFGYSRNPRVIHAGLECPSPLSMWSIMSAKSIPQSEVVNTNAVLNALTALPRHLRVVLAPTVSQRLVDFGDIEAAEAAIRVVQRLDGAANLNTQVALASLEIARGNTRNGLKELESVVGGEPNIPLEAIIDLMNQKVIDGTRVDPDMAVLIDSYAFQHADSDLGPLLRRAQFIALAKTNQFSAASELLLDNASEQVFKYDFSDLQSILLSELVQHADDIVFLDYIVSNIDQLAQGIDVKTINEVSERLLHLGFPDISLQVLRSSLEPREDFDSRLVRSEALTSLGDYDRALDILGEVEGIEADRVRARINELMGNNAEASLIYESAGDLGSSQLNAWLSSSWTSLIEDSDVLFGPSRSLASADLPSAKPDEQILKNLELLLGDSSDSRQAIAELLRNTAPRSVVADLTR